MQLPNAIAAHSSELPNAQNTLLWAAEHALCSSRQFSSNRTNQILREGSLIHIDLASQVDLMQIAI